MSVITTPGVTDNVAVVAVQVLARGSTVRGTLDLRSKLGAWLFIKIGRGGTTALSGGTTAGISIEINRVINNDTAVSGGQSDPILSLLSSVAAASSTTCATSNSNAGSPTLNVALITGFCLATGFVCKTTAEALHK